MRLPWSLSWKEGRARARRRPTGRAPAPTGQWLDRSARTAAVAVRAKRKRKATVQGGIPPVQAPVNGLPAFMERRFEASGALCIPWDAGRESGQPPALRTAGLLCALPRGKGCREAGMARLSGAAPACRSRVRVLGPVCGDSLSRCPAKRARRAVRRAPQA